MDENAIVDHKLFYVTNIYTHQEKRIIMAKKLAMQYLCTYIQSITKGHTKRHLNKGALNSIVCFGIQSPMHKNVTIDHENLF